LDPACGAQWGKAKTSLEPRDRSRVARAPLGSLGGRPRGLPSPVRAPDPHRTARARQKTLGALPPESLMLVSAPAYED